MTSRFARMCIAAGILVALTACGGGADEPDLPCGGTLPLSIAVAYEVNGTPLDVLTTIVLPRNVAVVATPRIVGLPAACAGAARLTVTDRTMTSPGGIVLDTSTGVMRGIESPRLS